MVVSMCCRISCVARGRERDRDRERAIVRERRADGVCVCVLRNSDRRLRAHA